jgi:hypothetical protein
MSQLQAVSEQLNILSDLDEKERIFQKLSQDLCNQIFVLMRSSGLYDLENKALEQPYLALIKTINDLYDTVKYPIQLRMNEGNFFVCRKQVKVDFTTYQNTRYLKKVFSHLDINEIQFDPNIQQSDLTLFLQTFIRVVKEGDLKMNQAMIPHMKMRTLNLEKVHELPQSKHPLDRLATSYAALLSSTTEFYLDVIHQRTPEYSLLKRVLLKLIELPNRCTPWLTCIEYLRERDEFTLIDQAVEATIFCATLAKTLRLDPNMKLTLLSACIQAFQGWTLLPANLYKMSDLRDTNGSDILFAGLQLDTSRLTMIRNEVMHHLLELGGMNETVIQKLVLIYESQRSPAINQVMTSESLNHEGGAPSHPKLQEQLYQSGLTQSFLSDLIYVSHYYVYLKNKTNAIDALKQIKKSHFSQFTLDLVEKMLGTYPLGTCLILSNGRPAIITRTYSDDTYQLKTILTSSTRAHKGRLAVGEELHIRETSPLQIQGVYTQFTRTQLAPVIFSRHSFPNKT